MNGAWGLILKTYSYASDPANLASATITLIIQEIPVWCRVNVSVSLLPHSCL